MTQTNVVLTVVQLILSVGVGLFIGLKLSPLIRKMVLAAMPMQQRMQEHFLRRLGLIAGTVTIVLAVLSAVFVHLSTASWFKSWGGRKMKTSSTQALQQPPNPGTNENEQHPDYIPQTPADEVQESTPRPQTTSLYPQHRPANVAFDPQGFYLQLEAFAQLSNAQRSATYWTQQSRNPLKVYLTHAEQGLAPFKVLLGPFPNMEAARQYRQQQGIPGFARSGQGLVEMKN